VCPRTMADVENVEPAEEILEMSTEKLDEISEKKKKNSLLSEVLVTGLLKNINEKVNNKLDNDAQSELVDIINEKVKDGYEGGLIDLESEVEKAISFDECPTNDHIIVTANKNRVTLPNNRRLPSKESKLTSCDTQQDIKDNLIIDNVDEDFEKLLKDDNVSESNQNMYTDNKECPKKCDESYSDDFDALLGEENTISINNENNVNFDIEADFDALVREENCETEEDPQLTVSNDQLGTILANTSMISDLEEKTSTYSNGVNSIEDNFKKLENNDDGVLNVKKLVGNGSLDQNDLHDKVEQDIKGNKTSNGSREIKDPFDDLFNELNETNLIDIEEGFQQIYAVENKKDIDYSIDCVVEETVDELLQEAAEFQDSAAPSVSQTGTDPDQKDLQIQKIENNNWLQLGTAEQKTGKEDAEHKREDSIVEEDYEEHNELANEIENSCKDEPNRNNEIMKSDEEIAENKLVFNNEVEMLKKRIEQLENDKENLQTAVEMLKDKQDVVQINESGRKVIIPTVNHDPEKLDEEILNDTREAELLIQIKHLSERVEVQDTLLAETKEDNTVLRIQNQSLLESINKTNSRKSRMMRLSSVDTPSLDWLDGEDSNEKKKLFLVEQELEDQKEVNKQLKDYVGDILINIIVQNPQILEKKQ